MPVCATSGSSWDTDIKALRPKEGKSDTWLQAILRYVLKDAIGCSSLHCILYNLYLWESGTGVGGRDPIGNKTGQDPKMWINKVGNLGTNGQMGQKDGQLLRWCIEQPRQSSISHFLRITCVAMSEKYCGRMVACYGSGG